MSINLGNETGIDYEKVERLKEKFKKGYGVLKAIRCQWSEVSMEQPRRIREQAENDYCNADNDPEKVQAAINKSFQASELAIKLVIEYTQDFIKEHKPLLNGKDKWLRDEMSDIIWDYDKRENMKEICFRCREIVNKINNFVKQEEELLKKEAERMKVLKRRMSAIVESCKNLNKSSRPYFIGIIKFARDYQDKYPRRIVELEAYLVKAEKFLEENKAMFNNGI